MRLAQGCPIIQNAKPKVSAETVIEPNETPQESEPIAAPGPLASRLITLEPFASQFVAEAHRLIVYLPPNYSLEKTRRFPVLYMHDGQNLFDPATAFIPGNHWRLGETADALIAVASIAPLIMVGIYNAGEKRINEYTPGEDMRLGGGQADAYGRMLVQELKPSIDRQFRTLPDAQHCGMGGSSLGGLVTLYLGLRYPEVFSRLAVMSPSVWWRKRAILKTVAALKQKPPSRVWLDIGTKESARAVPDTRALRDALIRKGWKPGVDLAYVEAENAEHTESAWAERVGPMLKFLFPGPASKSDL